MSAGLALLTRLMAQAWGVTVAVAVLISEALAEVPEAVATLMSALVMLIVRLLVIVWLAPGASGPQLPTLKSSAVLIGVPLSSLRVSDAAKKPPVLVTV